MAKRYDKQTIKKIRKIVLDNPGIKQKEFVQKFNDAGITTPYGRQFDIKAVHNVMRNFRNRRVVKNKAVTIIKPKDDAAVLIDLILDANLKANHKIELLKTLRK